MIGVPYLEENDVTPYGLAPNVSGNRPAVVMVQSTSCGWCTKAKPDFVRAFQQEPSIAFLTAQVDGQPSERNAARMLQKIASSNGGVPLFMGFDRNGKFVKVYNGNRSADDLIAFGKSL